jgi:hypothetical protein
MGFKHDAQFAAEWSEHAVERRDDHGMIDTALLDDTQREVTGRAFGVDNIAR